MALINYKNITKPDLMALRILTVVRHFQTFKLNLMALNSESNLLCLIFGYLLLKHIILPPPSLISHIYLHEYNYGTFVLVNI